MFLVGVGCVSAEHIDDSCGLSTIDNVTDEVISADDSIDDNLNVDENDALSGSRSSVDVNSWNGLRNAVNGDSGADVVNIQSSLTPGNQVVINHNVTIIGSSNTYIGGSSYNHKATYNDILFYSNATGLSITLKNIKFQNCGGNTLMKFAGNGTYVLDNCTFENITANGYKQVVVHLNEGTCNITDCTFEKCSSSYGTVSNFKNDDEPDAVHMYVYGTTFRNNYANVEPGAINNCGHLTVYDSTFEDNSAAMWAGAIHTHSNANATIFRSTFINNVAEWNGGALSTYSYLRVVNCTFTSNVARTDKGGGAIFGFSQGSRPYIIVENCDFDNNTAVTGNGGAIAIINGILVVDDSRFNDNVAGGNYGGAISSVGMGINDFITNVTGCRFINNSVSNMGGAIFAINMGHLRVYSSIFINDTATSGNEIAFRYTGKKTNKAFFTYEDNTFYGADNASGAIYLYNNNIVVVDINNIFLNTDQYVEPENETTPSVVPIPGNVPIGHQVWNASIEDVLGGSPLIIGDKIFVPKGQYVYCLNVTNGNVLWNVSSDAGYFHELALHGNVLLAPCAGDKLYMINPSTGDEIQSSSNIIQASSAFAPAIDGNTIYISSECGYGANNNTWIAVVEYNNGVYSYVGSILEIDGITYGDYALLSAPILWNNYLWVNTVNGLMRVDLATNTSTIVLANTVGKPVLGGDYLYVLTRNNHICGVNASGDLVKTISVSGNVGSTLAISNDNATLYTVNSNGEIYVVGVDEDVASFIYKINSFSHALTVGYDGYLYVGDNAGILWVFNIIPDIFGWDYNFVWAYNLTSMIDIAPLLDSNIVYVGTDDAFYALNYLSNVNNILGLNTKKSFNNYKNTVFDDILGSSSFDDILTNSKDVEGNSLTSTTFSESDTIYYLVSESYSFVSASNSGLLIGRNGNAAVNNIIIKPKDGKKVTINITKSNPNGIWIVMGNNITLENIKFSGNTSTSRPIFVISMGCTVTIKNCTFENCVNTNDATGTGLILVGKLGNAAAPNSVNIVNCNFINCSGKNYFLQCSDINSMNITGCTFDNITSKQDYPITFSSCNINWENNNIINPNNNIIFSIGGTNTNVFEVNFNVLTESLTVGETCSIVAKLVNDNEDYIYSPNLKFIINNVEETPTFDSTTGLYSVSYTPTETVAVNVTATCSNIEKLNAETIQIPVNKPLSNLTLGDDITFDYGQSGSTTVSYEGATNVTAEVVNCTATIKIENGNITVSGLDAGNYTLKVTTVADDDHANVTKTVNITVNKVDCDINIMNPVIYVYGNVGQCSVFSAGVIDFTASIINHTEAIINIDSNGIVNVSGLNVGKYVLEVTANPDKNHNSITRQTNVTVSEAESQITIPNIVFTYGESGSVNATLVGATGITNASVLNHTEAVVNIVNNTITVSGLVAGSYVLQATTIPDANHNPVTATANITVNGVEVPADKAISTNVPANTKSPTFSIKLEKDATGTFTVNIDNGKIVKTAELKDGAASITVADLTAGDHTISVSYSGDGKYSPITQNTTLNIKEPVKPTTKVTKKATKITAKKATFKAKKKTKKYTITLKSGKKLISKVKVTIKVGKKTYTAKTNKKGKATFNLKKLTKKGKYTAVIKFKGNKNYKATSKKVKITVKK